MVILLKLKLERRDCDPQDGSLDAMCDDWSAESLCIHMILNKCVWGAYRIKYYNNCLFHNVQKDFIVQTGDPTGSGRGGMSINGYDATASSAHQSHFCYNVHLFTITQAKGHSQGANLMRVEML